MLESHHGALDTLHKAATLERSSYAIEYRDGLDAEIPDLVAMVRATRFLIGEARVAAADDDPEHTLLALATISRIATSLQEESTLVTALVGIACERLLLAAAPEMVGCSRPWAAQSGFLADLEAVVPTIDRIETLTRALDTWTVVMIDGTAPGDDSRGPGLPFSMRPFPDLARSDVLRTRHDVAELLEIPFGCEPGRFMPPPRPDRDKTAMRENEWAFVTALARAQSVAAQRQLVRAGIALRRLARAEGAYPVERPSIELLTTPDPFTGRLLLYTPHQDGSLEIELDGAARLVEQGKLFTQPQSVMPIVLPPVGD